MRTVQQIIKEVKEQGDRAVAKYTAFFDGEKLKNFQVSKPEIKKAYSLVEKTTIDALKKAANNIKRFAQLQMKQFQDFERQDNGVLLGQRVVPLGRVGVYVPGGRYPLPSSALMAVVPAKVAGVKEVVVCSPKIKPATIVAADLAGADVIFRIGGVQAIAAMAFGTKTIPKVDKIVGPGNTYVTLAKKEVFGLCGIDFLAGPSEILVIADRNANPSFVASDLLAQAEHDREAKIILISTSPALIKKVKQEITKQLRNLATKEVIKQALKKKKVICVKTLKQAIKLANEIAPEHLEFYVKNSRKYLKQLKNYGSLFLGEYSAVAFGDYCSGPNHILPTNGTARFTGGLSVKDFLKIQTYQQITEQGARHLAKTAILLAEAEGLEAHKKSVELRYNITKTSLQQAAGRIH